MRRLLLSFLVVLLTISGTIVPVPVSAAGISVVYNWKTFSATSSTPLVVATTTVSGHLLVAVYETQNTSGCPTVTPNTGWTVAGDSGCVLTKNRMTVLTHVASGETSDQPLASLSVAANQSVIIYDISGANNTTPFDVAPTFATMSTTSTTPATPSITTTVNGDLLLAAWATQVRTPNPNSISSGWTQIDNNNGAFETSGYESGASVGSITGPTITYSAANSSGIVSTMAVVPAAAATINQFTLMGVGGPHTSIVINPAAVAAYAPSVMYVGTGTGQGGLCGGTGPYTACTSAANIKAANVKWIEGNIGDTHLDPATGDWVGGAYCSQSAGSCALGYSSFMSNSCNLTAQTTVYNDITGAVTTGFLHNSGQTGTNYLNGGPSGSCGSYTTRVWQYAADTTGQAKVLADWFNSNASGTHTINGRTWYTNVDDNFELPPSVAGSYSSASTAEYGTKWPDAAQNSQRDLGKWLAAMSPYPQFTNMLAVGGGHYGLCTAAVGANCADGAHASVGTTGSQAYMRFTYLACDNDTTGNFVAALAERALMSGGPSSAVNWLGYYDIPVLANTLSWMYTDHNCDGVNIVDLEPPASSGTNLLAARMGSLGLRLLLEPNNYDGVATTRAFMNWEYTDCASCTNTIGLYPEYGLVMTNPQPSIGQWSYGSDSGTDGNGCGAHDSGGIQSLLIAGTCGLGTDEQGSSSGVYHRSGQCALFGVAKGNCTVIWNDTKSTQTIQNSWCAAGCSSLPYAVQPTGNEEQYLYDNPASGTLNPNATGAYGTVSAPTTIGSCETSANTLATPCFVVLVQTQ